MRSHRFRNLVALISLLTVIVPPPAGQPILAQQPKPSIYHVTPATTPLDPASEAIAVTANGFEPTTVTVTVGTQVVWTNQTAQTHTLKSGEPVRVYIPLVLRQALHAVNTLSRLQPSPSVKTSPILADDFGGTIVPGSTYTHAFDTIGEYPYYLATAPNHTGRIIAISNLPPDPATVAPPLDMTVPTGLFTATQFLYSGAHPIQTGVPPGTITAQRVAILRGRVLARDGTPLSGARITIPLHPEFGQTLSRDDGMFDLTVNGGTQLTVGYQKEGFLPAQRRVEVPWQDYVRLPDVALIIPDPHVTSVDVVSPSEMQLAQGSVISDSHGVRQQTLLFLSGVQASMTLSDGVTQTLTTLDVRATEYTVGATGPEAMPDDMPANTGYTYAVDLSVDQALAASALDVQFNQPVVAYLENWLTGTVGGVVPAGYYDRVTASWVPSENGRIVQIITVTNGLADLDTDGDHQVDNGVVVTPSMTLTITVAERQRLAQLYKPGQSLWRVPIWHFSTWDFNWAFGPPPDATFPNQPPPTGDNPIPNACEKSGSIIACQNQVLGEAVDVVGTPFALHYVSSRVKGRKAAYSLDIPLSGATVPASLVGIVVEIQVAGRYYRDSISKYIPCVNQNPRLSSTPSRLSGPGHMPSVLADLTNQHYSFTWDGKDAYQRTVQGQQRVSVRIGYEYCGVYMKTDRFGYNGGGWIDGSLTRRLITFWQEWDSMWGGWNALTQGLGGWSLDVQHVYNSLDNTLYLGTGEQRTTRAKGTAVNTIAQTQNLSGTPWGVALGSDGSVFFPQGHAVYRRDPSGTIRRVAGSPANNAGYSGDGGPAIDALLNQPSDVRVAADGSLYIADTGNNRVRRVGPDGIITTVAGNGGKGYSPDGLSATGSQVYNPIAIALGPDSSLYILHQRQELVGVQYVRRVTTDGLLVTVAGKLNPAPFICTGDGGKATNAEFDDMWDIDVAQDGNLYIATLCNGERVRRVTPDGIIHTFAGGGTCSSEHCGDGGQAVDARLAAAMAVAAAPDGSLYIVDGVSSPSGDCVRRVSSDGIISRVAGLCGNGGYSGDGGLATQARFSSIDDISVGPDGNLYIADSNNWRIRRVAPILPGWSFGDQLIPAEAGNEVYHFDQSGRHLRTLNALTGAAMYQFTYDASGNLIGIRDGDGNVTTVQRDANGNPNGILAPLGQVTALALDANGYLSRITNPAGETTQLSYTPDGLMTTLTTPRGYVHHFDYDAQGRLTRDVAPTAGSQVLTRTAITQTYTVAYSTPLSRTTNYRVEMLRTGDMQRINTFPDGTHSESLEKIDGSTQNQPSDGSKTTLVNGPDPRWGMQAPVASTSVVAMPSGLSISMSQNRTANLADPSHPLSLTSMTDLFSVNGRSLSQVYVAANRTFTVTTPQGRQTSTTIDAQGRVGRVQQAGLYPNTYAYDAQGRLITTTFGTGNDVRTVGFTYNTAGYIETITDPLGNVVHLAYDSAGRVTTQTLPGDRVVAYAYDTNGNVVGITPPGKPAHAFSYTPIDLLQTYTPPDVGNGGTTTRYTYDLDRALARVERPDGLVVDLGYDVGGRLNTMTMPHGVMSYGYAPATGQLVSVTAPGGLTLTYGYDGSLVTNTTWAGPVSGTVQYGYDRDFRVVTETVNGDLTITYGYDGDSLFTRAGDLMLSRDPKNGLLTGSRLGNVTDTWSYNGFGEPLTYTAYFSGALLFRQAFGYDRLGRIVTKTETVSGVTTVYSYVYDAAGRLSEAWQDGVQTSRYTYDLNGNRLSHTTSSGTVTGMYDAQDRLKAYGTATYIYTANGELKAKTEGSQTTTYNHDVLRNLTRVVLPDGTVVEYLIDGQNRRVGQKVNGVPVKGWVYGDQLRPVAELDGAGNVTARFVYATHINVPDYIMRDSAIYRTILDHQGSVRLVVNTITGAVVQQLSYYEYGNMLEGINVDWQPFGFAGGLVDSETQLVHYAARDYDPRIGRWLTKDQLRFSDGDINLYAYALGDPLNMIDVDGMKPEPSDYSKHAQDSQYCRDTCFTGALHEGTCFREVPDKAGNPGEHTCFDPLTRTMTSSHIDRISPVKQRGEGGECIMHPFWGPVHFLLEGVPNIFDTQKMLHDYSDPNRIPGFGWQWRFNGP